MQGNVVDFDNRDDEVKYSKIKIGLASPEMIEDWSFGEVLKPETINYRSLRPEKDGLFCEKIFGTTRDWECFCGKYKSMRYRGMTCDRCGVEITHSQIRRERMGHIKLAAPVAHIWFYKAVPSRIGLVLNLTIVDLKSIIYYEKYIVLNPGDVPDLKKYQLLTEVEYFDLYDEYGDKFEAGIGAEVIRDMLMSLDLEQESLNLREKMAKSKTFDKRSMLRLGLLEDFLHSSNQPEWMLLSSIPVLPPELRPMVQLDGGRFATSDLNDLYRRLINRNNRLKKLIAFKAPDIIVKNEKRMLQEAVDALFDNSRRKRSVKGSGNRPLKSLSDILKGKQGRFRQNLLGKRVDYSARSVIVVGPDLKLHQCGIPKKMALELFRPFIMNKLMEKKLVFNVRGAKRLIDKDFPEVWNILEKVVAGHPVLLNRAPTLHRLGMQAFEPVLIEGKAIRLHPLVCAAYNADFDGDQMAVHLPLSAEAQIEAWTLMLSSFNILDPANGAPVVNPSQDIVLGIYNLTNIKTGARGEGKVFSSQVEMSKAFDLGYLSLQALIKCEVDGELVETTYGRLIFSEIFPEDYSERLVKEVVADVNLGDIIAGVYKECGNYETVLMLDRIKEVGFKYSTVFANTISLEDIVIPDEKSSIILDAQEKSRKNSLDYQSGIITEDERYQKNISLWTYTIDQVAEKMMNTLEHDQLGHNSLYVMAKSGARGSTQQIRQLAGMRGLMAKPSGDIIDMPIISNFKEGLDVLEYFISTHGARKGLSDTALKTADAGYLTRKLVDIAQDVTITEDDCGTISGINVYPIKSGDEFIERLSERVVGRYSAENIINPFTEEILLTADQLIEEKVALEIDSLEIEKIKIRTVVTCDSSHGICRKCYGVSLTTNQMVEIGEAVGIVASQSIGQPGTQLTMRTFHVGGAASSEVRDSFFKSPFDAYFRSVPDNLVKNPAGELITARRGFITLDTVYEKWKTADFKKIKVKTGSFVKVNEVIGEDKKGEAIVIKKSGQVFIDEKNKRVIHTSSSSQFPLEIGSTFVKQAGEYIEQDEIIYTFDNINEPLIAEISGTVRFQDIVLGKNLRDEIDDYTGVTTKKIVASKEEKLQPKLVLVGKGDETIELEIPIGSNLLVEDGQKIKAGEILSVRIRPMQKTTDITGGLPRVQELFEARNPSSPAIIAEIDGEVEIGEAKKSKRIVYVVSEYGRKVPHIVEIGKALLVRTGDFVKCGELLCDGMVNPHDILRVSGDVELYRFVLRNVQEVYKRQGVNINDKHIGVIVRQMLRKVEVVDSGDASYIRNELVDKYRVRKENQEILKEGGKPATVRSVLLGLTKASLNTESFISSASFQETSKVLSNAAIRNAEDNLVGLKENVIIGQKIPAGTGSISYNDMTVYKEIPGDLDYLMGEID